MSHLELGSLLATIISIIGIISLGVCIQQHLKKNIKPNAIFHPSTFILVIIISTALIWLSLHEAQAIDRLIFSLECIILGCLNIQLAWNQIITLRSSSPRHHILEKGEAWPSYRYKSRN